MTSGSAREAAPEGARRQTELAGGAWESGRRWSGSAEGAARWPVAGADSTSTIAVAEIEGLLGSTTPAAQQE